MGYIIVPIFIFAGVILGAILGYFAGAYEGIELVCTNIVDDPTISMVNNCIAHMYDKFIQ